MGLCEIQRRGAELHLRRERRVLDCDATRILAYWNISQVRREWNDRGAGEFSSFDSPQRDQARMVGTTVSVAGLFEVTDRSFLPPRSFLCVEKPISEARRRNSQT